MYNTTATSRFSPRSVSDSHDIMWKNERSKNSFFSSFGLRSSDSAENEIDISHHKLNNNYSQKCVLNANHFVGNNGIF
jgi:hypothetical protein